MARELPPSRLTASRLVRLLAHLNGAEPAQGRQPFAERLGQWLDFSDAIPLFATIHGSGGARVAGGPPGPGLAGLPPQEAYARVRRTLAQSIIADEVVTPGPARIKSPVPPLSAPAGRAMDFAPYQRDYLAHQRDMSSAIAPLRAHVRAALAGRSAPLRQLAALDAQLDQALAGRERELLATVPQLLGKHFARLQEAHRQAPDDPGPWPQPGGWLAEFNSDMQAVLLAELDIRLQPVAGLVAALGNEVTKHL